MKILITLLIALNIGFLGWNAWRFYERTLSPEQSGVIDRAIEEAESVRVAMFQLKADLQRISSAKLESVENPSAYFERQCKVAGLDSGRDEINIPFRSDESSGGRVWQEESWKITFRNRDKVYPLSALAKYCQAIEMSSPGFQIKALDAGKREGVWGKDEWKPQQIVIRRITPKAQS